MTPAGGAGPARGEIGSTYPTNDWVTGEIVVDRETIPVNVATVTVDWRERATGKVVGSTTIPLRDTAP
jgi:hypothetical protein